MSRFSIHSLKSEGHSGACTCEECKVVIRNVVMFRQWHAELDGACIVDEDNRCVGCINCALDPLRAHIQQQAAIR